MAYLKEASHAVSLTGLRRGQDWVTVTCPCSWPPRFSVSGPLTVTSTPLSPGLCGTSLPPPTLLLISPWGLSVTTLRLRSLPPCCLLSPFVLSIPDDRLSSSTVSSSLLSSSSDESEFSWRYWRSSSRDLVWSTQFWILSESITFPRCSVLLGLSVLFGVPCFDLSPGSARRVELPSPSVRDECVEMASQLSTVRPEFWDSISVLRS